MLTKEQIEERKLYLGGSDCAAVLGLSRWSSPLMVWLEKTGQAEPKDLSENLAVELGNELEDVVVRLFEKRTGLKTRRVNESIRHEKYPFIGGRIDRSIVGSDAILEAKTCSGWKAAEWAGEDIPQEYSLQVMHYLAVTGKKVGYIACLIGGNQKFVYKRIERDEDMIRSIIEREVYFWREFVEKGIMPSVITAIDGDALYGMYPQQEVGKQIELDDETVKIVEARDAYLADKRMIEKQLDTCDNQIKAALGKAESAKAGKWLISWKTQEQNRINTEKLKEEMPDIVSRYSCKTSFRKLTIKESKENK